MLSTILTAAVLAVPGPSEDLHALFEDFDEWYLSEYPSAAMRRGDYSNADRLTDDSLAAIERRHETRTQYHERLQAIDRTRLSEHDLVSAELFDLRMSRSIEGHRFRSFLAPMSSRSGPHQRVPQMGDHVRFDSVRDYESYLSRLEQTPKMIEDVIALMNLGLREQRVPPRVTLDGVPEQFTALLDDGGLERLREPLERMPAYIDEATQKRLRARFERASLPVVRQALARLQRFVVDHYIPGCRDSIDASSWPDGAAYYAHRLRVMTTTNLSARKIHELGLAEVARIRGEMLDVIRRSDFMTIHPDAETLGDDALFAAFVDYLRTDSRFYYSDPEDLLDGYKAICKTVDGLMPEYFGILPRQPYGVKEIPAFMAARQTTAYYRGGDLRNAEAGFFYANTYDLAQRPKYDMIALALHEAVPGHHHQIAIARELEGVPEFRKETWFTAYGEGWALYTERLGIEMGLYEDPYDDFGRLGFEMWRACRLVVDPGMHALGWSRQRAIEFMMRHTALAELNIINEIDRYIAWPGQATAYKIGELRIRELREKAEQTLGDRFDIRGFHDVILSAGAVPLNVLDRRVNQWIDAQ